MRERGRTCVYGVLVSVRPGTCHVLLTEIGEKDGVRVRRGGERERYHLIPGPLDGVFDGGRKGLESTVRHVLVWRVLL